MKHYSVAIWEFNPMVGGGQKVAFLEAELLARRGHAVTVLTPKPIGKSWFEDHFGVDFSNVRLGSIAVENRSGQPVPVLDKPYDVFINAEYGFWTIDPGAAKVRFIVAHDAHPIDRETDFLLKYHAVLPSSHYGASKLADEKWPIPAKVLYPPIYKTIAPVGPKDRFLNEGRQNIIMVVGRFDAMRGWNSFPTVIEAFKRACDTGLTGWELCFAGWILNPQVFSNLVDRTKGYPVRFVGSPSSHQLQTLYARAKYLLNLRGIDMPLPSTPFSHEALGVVTVEAISNGVVPIVHDYAGHLETCPIPDLRIPGHKEDVSAIPSRLIEILGTPPDQRQRYWEELNENAVAKFSENAFIRRFEGLVEEVWQQ